MPSEASLALTPLDQRCIHREGLSIDADKEAAIALGETGIFVVVETYASNPLGTSYVRIVDDEGYEHVYWCVDEWEEAGENVMGAIFGCICGVLDSDYGKGRMFTRLMHAINTRKEHVQHDQESAEEEETPPTS